VKTGSPAAVDYTEFDDVDAVYKPLQIDVMSRRYLPLYGITYGDIPPIEQDLLNVVVGHGFDVNDGGRRVKSAQVDCGPKRINSRRPA
jgi:hypothetical protein